MLRGLVISALVLLEFAIIILGTSVMSHIGKGREWRIAWVRHYEPTPENKAALVAAIKKGRPRVLYAAALFGALFIGNAVLIVRLVRSKNSATPKVATT